MLKTRLAGNRAGDLPSIEVKDSGWWGLALVGPFERFLELLLKDLVSPVFTIHAIFEHGFGFDLLLLASTQGLVPTDPGLLWAFLVQNVTVDPINDQLRRAARALHLQGFVQDQCVRHGPRSALFIIFDDRDLTVALPLVAHKDPPDILTVYALALGPYRSVRPQFGAYPAGNSGPVSALPARIFAHCPRCVRDVASVSRRRQLGEAPQETRAGHVGALQRLRFITDKTHQNCRSMDGLPRIVSLIASSTEIVCALGLQDQLVGRSHECDYPPTVNSLPICTEPKFLDGTSYQIDERIKAILQEGLSVYRVDAALLKQLAPNVIITQTQCDVCAVSLADVEAAVCDTLGSQPRIVALEPNALEDIFSDIERVADALGVADRGADVVSALRRRMVDVDRQVATIGERPTVVCIEWIEPLMAAGNWMPELVQKAGGVNVVGRAGEHAHWLEWDNLVALDPDVILVLPCGFDIERTRQEIVPLTTKPEWSKLRAVATRRVYLADGNQFFNRPGPRVAEALEIMAEMLHPGPFEFSHEGIGWQLLSEEEE